MREWKFPSSSSPQIYTTQINPASGLLSCDCRGWVTKKLGKTRTCKHTKKVIEDEGLLIDERDGQQFVVDPRSGTLTSGEIAHLQRVTAKANAAIARGEKSAGLTAGNSTPAVVHDSKPQTKPTPALQDHPSTFISPMLASKMPEGKDADSFDANHQPPMTHWIMEQKFDGHRLVVRVGETGSGVIIPTVTAWSRLGNPRTLPDHLLNLFMNMPVGVYDGELLVPGMHSYDVTAGQNSGSERLVLFDILEVLGHSVMQESYAKRRDYLCEAFRALDDDPEFISIAVQYLPSMKKVREIWDGGGEGAIIKNVNSKYQPGWRTPDWVKVKKVLAATLTVIGFEAGKNGPYSVVKLRDDGTGVETTVKTIDNKTMRQIALNPDAFIGKRLVISYHEKTPNGHWRHPMWDHVAGEGE